MNAPNPRAVTGDNRAPDYAKMEQERLAAEYGGYTNTLAELSAEAETRDAPIPDDENADDTALQAGALIKRFRDLDKRIEETRVVEVEPHLRRQNAANAFFKGLRRMIQGETPQERRTSPGWIDRLQARINAHQDRKEARERARLEAENRERQRLADVARQKAEDEAKEAARLEVQAQAQREAADRARKPETVEQKTLVADETQQRAQEQSAAAVAASVAADQATDAAQDARIATLAKPADIVRTRGVTDQGAGVTLTKAKEKYCILADRDAIDAPTWARLGPFFTDEAIQVAGNKFARATNHREQLPGFEIGERTKGVVR